MATLQSRLNLAKLDKASASTITNVTNQLTTATTQLQQLRANRDFDGVSSAQAGLCQFGCDRFGIGSRKNTQSRKVRVLGGFVPASSWVPASPS